MGYKLTLFSNPGSLKPEVKCAACACVLDCPVRLPCTGGHLACLGCVRTQRQRQQEQETRQRLFRCPLCDDPISSEFASAVAASDPGVPNWVRVELNSLRLACPRRCGAVGLRIAELERHFEADCGKTQLVCGNAGCSAAYKREAEASHQEECQFRRVQCSVCRKSMLNKDLLSHQVKTRCHELEMKLARKQCIKQCNKDVLDHYRLLREHSLLAMQEMRRSEFSHLQRMGVQGFVRREPLPLLPSLATGETFRRCDRCNRMYNNETNHDMACRWHGGPTFGGLCLACGKPSHTEGCIISAHHQESVALPPTASKSSVTGAVQVRN